MKMACLIHMSKFDFRSNADQNSGIDPNVNQFQSIPINADQCLSMPDRNRYAMRGISDQCNNFDRH